jgi:CubicO group peptidase (beta-lactamase class C family)
MKKSIYIILLCIPLSGWAQSLYFPPVTGDAWETISPQSLHWNQNSINSLYLFLEENNTKAFILLKDGKIVLEKYFGEHTAETPWYWASAGKSLTAFLVGIAQQEKYLAVSDPTSVYLGKGWTSCSPEQEDKITILHQLTMTTGLDDTNSFCTRNDCLTYKAEPGTRWAYNNAPYTLLDDVVNKATGSTLSEYLALKLSNQTGITGAYRLTGYNKIFASTARSMARFGLLVLNKGNWNGQPIITDADYFSRMLKPSQSLNESYGYLWWLNGYATYRQPQTQKVFTGPLIPGAPADAVAALGANGQIINVVPSQRLVLIRMGEAPKKLKESGASADLNRQIWQYINQFEK